MIVVSEPVLRAEIDTQIATAKNYPRSVKRALDDAKSMVLLSEEIAAACCYSVPRGGRSIKGPSVRLAEIVASAWGNIRVEKRAGEILQDWVTAEGVVWDLERNVAIRITKKRRITDSHGRRYSDDMIQNTLNAAASICLRDAVFVVVPKSFVWTVYDAAEDLAVGKVESLADRRGKAIDYVKRWGITPEKVATRFERPSMEELTLDDVAALKALCEQIKRGEITVEQAFPDRPDTEGDDDDAPPADAGSVARAVVAKVTGQQPAAAGTGIGAGVPPEGPDVAARRQQLKDQADKIKADAAAKAPASDATGTPAEGSGPSGAPAAPAAPAACAPGNPGCSTDPGDYSTVDGRRVCANHAAAPAPGATPPLTLTGEPEAKTGKGKGKGGSKG